MPVDADFLGDYLRQVRESRQVSLQDISAATKVQLKFLEAIEEDDYDRLPPAPFVVGFLRAYAQCLSLRPEEIIAAYHERYGSSASLPGHRLPVAYQVKHSRPIGWKGVGMAVVILVAGLAWLTWRPGQEKRTASVPSPGAIDQTPEASKVDAQMALSMSETSRPQPLASDSISGRESTGTPPVSAPLAAVVTPGGPVPEPFETVVETSPSEAVPPAPASTPLVLQATAVEDTWLQVDIDGDARRSLLLTAGNRVQWEADERFVLKIGNAQGTRLSLNGREVTLPPTRDNVVRNFVVTRDAMN